MKINYNNKTKELLVEITEEIDHHEVEKNRKKIDGEITSFFPRKVIFDFNNVTFMDSAGIGLILGRYKTMKMLGGNIEIINVSQKLKKIFEMSGITRICKLKQAS